MINPLEQYIDGMVSGVEQRMGIKPAPVVREDRRCDLEHREMFARVLVGDESCGFWPRNDWREATDGPDYSMEQELAIFCAVRRACALPCASPADRWAIVEREVREWAMRYADDEREVRESR